MTPSTTCATGRAISSGTNTSRGCVVTPSSVWCRRLTALSGGWQDSGCYSTKHTAAQPLWTSTRRRFRSQIDASFYYVCTAKKYFESESELSSQICGEIDFGNASICLMRHRLVAGLWVVLHQLHRSSASGVRQRGWMRVRRRDLRHQRGACARG